MGSLKPCLRQNANYYAYIYSDQYLYPRQPLPEETENADHTIITLVNSVYYFLECVYILYRQGGYQLVVLHNNRVLTYKNYQTLRGAKIAFQKMYNKKAWKNNVKADWSHSYPADSHWLGQKDKMLFNEPLKAYSI